MRFILGVHRHLSKSRIPVITGIFTVASLAVFAFLDFGVRSSGASGIVSLQLAFSQERFTSIVAGWNPDTFKLYKLALLWDYAFPLLYVPFLAGFIARSFPISDTENPSFFYLVLFILPFDAGLLDWIENSLHIVLLNGVPPYSTTMIFIASLAALLKWIYIVVAVLAVLYSWTCGKIKSGL